MRCWRQARADEKGRLAASRRAEKNAAAIEELRRRGPIAALETMRAGAGRRLNAETGK